jgi:hypothetical protein
LASPAGPLSVTRSSNLAGTERIVGVAALTPLIECYLRSSSSGENGGVVTEAEEADVAVARRGMWHRGPEVET